MKLLTIVLLISLVPLSRAADWRFGSMRIQWLDGYKKTPNDTAERFVGPGNEIVLVTAMGLREGGDAGKMVKTYLAFGENELPRLSAAKGDDVTKPRREDLVGGITLFSTAAVPKQDNKMFYLQFLAVSPTGRCALITVEGYGNPVTELKRFRPLFDTITWMANQKKG